MTNNVNEEALKQFMVGHIEQLTIYTQAESERLMNGLRNGTITIVDYDNGGGTVAGSEKGREITPHKGGRTERVPSARMTEDERTRLNEVLKATGESFTDWIMRHVEADEKKISDKSA